MTQQRGDVYYIKGYELRAYDYDCLKTRVEIWLNGQKRCERIIKGSSTRRAAQTAIKNYLADRAEGIVFSR